MTDPIADMLNRIRNSQAVLQETVSVPFSKIKYEIASAVHRAGFIKDIEKKGRKEKRIIKITLKKDFLISGLKRISKPGQRIYISHKDIKPIRKGYGITVISTSGGVMLDKEARKNKLGGEVICEIW